MIIDHHIAIDYHSYLMVKDKITSTAFSSCNANTSPQLKPKRHAKHLKPRICTMNHQDLYPLLAINQRKLRKFASCDGCEPPLAPRCDPADTKHRARPRPRGAGRGQPGGWRDRGGTWKILIMVNDGSLIMVG